MHILILLLALKLLQVRLHIDITVRVGVLGVCLLALRLGPARCSRCTT